VAEDYTYIVARLRALEATMPERAWFERLARTPEANLLGALREYYHGFEGVSSLAEFEKALETEKQATLDLIAGLLREEHPRQFVRAGYDFDNLTHAWKAIKLGAGAALTSFGLVPPEVTEQAAAGKSRGILPPYLDGHVEALEAVYEETKSLAACEYAAEAAKWRFLFDRAPDENAKRYLGFKIDWINIKNFLRLRRSSLRKEALDRIWLEGGEIETARFKDLFRDPEEVFFSFIATTSCARALGFCLASEMPLWMVDVVMRQALMGMLGESRYRFFDFSPVLYHIELRERDFEMLRRLIVGALNRLPEAMVLERVNALLPS
jgi:vacuolar-type H+-ATPase subunit C/Vma6